MKTHRFVSFRALLFGAVVCGSALLGSPSAKAGSPIQWQKEGATVLASEQKRPILLRFTASWCPPCRVMNTSVWSDPGVAERVNKEFIPVELDIDLPPAQEIAQKFGIVAVPTIILLNENGEEVDRANFMDVKQTLKFLNKASKE